MLAMVIMAYCHCVLHIDGFAMWMWQSMLSGVISTDLLNGVAVWLVLCIAWYFVTGKGFRENVNLVVLGDDHAGGMTAAGRKAFDPERFAAVLRHVGFVYTNEDKTLDFGSFFKNPEDAKFLQRCWVAEGSLWKAPLALKRALRCLWLYAPSSHVRQAE